MIRFTKYSALALGGGLMLGAAACSSSQPHGRYSTTPTYYSHTAGGTPVYTAQGGSDINQTRVDETDMTGPGTPRGDRTSADPSETSTQGAGSRALVGQPTPPARDTTATTMQTRPVTPPTELTARGGAEIEDQGSASTGQQQNTVIPLYKETVNVGKRQVDAGTVTIRKNVQTETVNQPVELRSETVTIDRQPAGTTGTSGTSGSTSFTQGGGDQTGQPFQQREYTIHLSREEPVVEKRVVPAGEVVARTTVQTQRTNIQSQVRREDVQVDRGTAGNVQIREENAGGSANLGESSRSATAAGNAITDITQLSGAQASSMVGRQVTLQNAKIRAVVGPQVIALESGGQPVYVRLQQPMNNLKEGMTVNVTGTAQAPSQISTESLTGENAHILSAQPVVIDAQSVNSTQ